MNDTINATSPLLTAENNWYEVWPVGERRSGFRSWAEGMAYVKANEYFKGTSVFKHVFQLGTFRKNLEAKYLQLQQVMMQLSPEDARVMAHLPALTQESVKQQHNEIVYVDYFASIGLRTFAPGESYDSLKASLQTSLGDTALLHDTTVGVDPALSYEYTKLAQDGSFEVALTQYTIFPVGKSFTIQLTVQTVLDEAAKNLSSLTQQILDGFVITS